MALKKLPDQTVDPDATDELPALQFAEPAEGHISTDVFPAPVIPAGMVELADSLRDVEQRLQRKIERVGQLEAEAQLAADQSREQGEHLRQQESAAATLEAALRADLTDRERQLTQLRDELSTTQRAMTEARGQLQEQLAAMTAAQGRLSERSSEYNHASHDAAEWRRRAERQLEALMTWQTFRSVSEARLGESESALREVESRQQVTHAAAAVRAQELEALLAREQEQATLQIAGLEKSLREAGQSQGEQQEALQAMTAQVAELRVRLEAQQADEKRLQSQLDELRAVEDQARQGAARHEHQQKTIDTLQTDLSAAEARILELEQQLQHSASRVARLESEAHAGAALLGNLQQNMDRLGREESGSRPALKEIAPDVVRMLVRQEGGADVVYRLGRRTTVGRTADNDIQVDSTSVSRHHAVLLSSAEHCIVEDLNSTNGVLVNGRRVGRHILQDGDMVTVGKTEFRYQQRS